MDSPTARRSSSARRRSSSNLRRIHGVLLSLFLVACQERVALQDPAPALVSDCHPCTFSVGPNTPAYSFTFQIDSSSGDNKAISAIVVRRGTSRESDQLAVDMTPVAKKGKFFFGAADLDFDGYRDLVLATSRGVANTYAQYWRFAPQTGRFVPLGKYPIFTVDTAGRRLHTYERGGDGGRIYQSSEYGFVRDTLRILKSESQEATDKPGLYLKILRERDGDSLRTVRTDSIKEPGGR